MTRLIATRVSDEAYSKIMGKCSGLGCSVYDYLKMIVETDLNDIKDVRRVEGKLKARRDPEINERLRRLAGREAERG